MGVPGVAEEFDGDEPAGEGVEEGDDDNAGDDWSCTTLNQVSGSAARPMRIQNGYVLRSISKKLRIP